LIRGHQRIPAADFARIAAIDLAGLDVLKTVEESDDLNAALVQANREEDRKRKE
jgi:uncharacterized protein YqfA (UPF0365 family)